MEYYLIILLVILISICMPFNVYASDEREGLLIGIGGGTSKTEITFKLNDGTKDTYISNGFAFSARLGWCFNKYAIIYWDMRESAYFDYRPANNNTYHAGLWSALGLSLYLNTKPNSLYVTGSVGLGDLETGEIGTDAIVGLGISYLMGLGYIISNSFGIEISTMKTKIGKNDQLENDFTAESVRLTVYWQFPI
jgi:hypothetical protein